MAYSELIKNFDRIRDYMRQFYAYGFKSRKEAFAKLSLREYREEMSGIYTTCFSRDTLDESPMAYKGIWESISQIGPTVDIVEQIQPVYNFKAHDPL